MTFTVVLLTLAVCFVGLSLEYVLTFLNWGSWRSELLHKAHMISAEYRALAGLERLEVAEWQLVSDAIALHLGGSLTP